MGTQGVLAILFRGLVLVAFAEDEKVCSSGSNRSARSLFTQFAAPRTFPKFVFFLFANHEDPFLARLDPRLAGRFSTSVFQELEPGRRVIGGREE